MKLKFMNKVFIAFTVIVALSFCSGQENNIQNKEMDLIQLKSLLSGKEAFLLVDVREPEEYASGHIPKAINIPQTIINSKTTISKKDLFIILYCRSGNRSAQAEKTLRENGYNNIVNFGSIAKWKDALVTGDKPE